ncbi:MAG: hypothetical protein JSS07_10725 [Proteobacteria bacterium]|nr:hypothetical protein [Pseudomonadota bacterium]
MVKRFKKIMLGFMKKTTSTISSTFNCWSDIKSSYRFMNNDKITLEKIMEPHRNKTIERCSQENKILLIRDTTYLDYKNIKQTEGLDYLQRNKKTKIPICGLILHNTLAISLTGVPLGLLDQRYILLPL